MLDVRQAVGRTGHGRTARAGHLRGARRLSGRRAVRECRRRPSPRPLARRPGHVVLDRGAAGRRPGCHATRFLDEQRDARFPINDAHAFAVAVRVLSAEGMRAKLKALRSLTWSEFRSLLRVMRLGRRQQKGTPRKPYQQLRYWSTVPFLHGGRDAIKYSAIPAKTIRRVRFRPVRTVLQDELVRHVNEDAQMSEFDVRAAVPRTGDDDARAGKRRNRRSGSRTPPSSGTSANRRSMSSRGCGCCRSRCCRRPRPRRSAIDVTEHSTPDSRPIGSINRARWHAESASRAARLAQPVVGQRVDTGQTSGGDSRGARLGIAALVFVAALGWALGPSREICPGLTC